MNQSSPVNVVMTAEPISLADGLSRWASGIKVKVARAILGHLEQSTDHLDRYIECAEVAEIPGLFVACAFYQRDINQALTRTGLFMGAGKGLARGTLARRDDPVLLNYQKLVAGHNLPGPVIDDFLQASRSADDPARQPNEVEAAFFTALADSARVRQRAGHYYLIACSVQSTKDLAAVISHEVYHAHYFLNPEYRRVVRRFWADEVTTEDRALITTEIGRAYNVDDEDLVIDEFQAYLVQDRAEFDLVKAFVPRYQLTLRGELALIGINFSRP